jgi:hypothetical protein
MMSNYERACKTVDELYAEAAIISQHDMETTKTILRKKIIEALNDAIIEFENRPQPQVTHVHIG